MRTQLQGRMLHFLSAQSRDMGFSLWTLMGLLLLLGALGAIVLPSFFQPRGGCLPSPQSEARRHIGSMNRAQQAYYLENETFATTVTDLGVGINSQTSKRFFFSSDRQHNAAFSYAIADRSPEKLSNQRLNNYVGAVYVTPQKKNGEIVVLEIICEANSPAIGRLTLPTYQKGVLACGKNTKDISGSKH
jgi:type IV pilus assembly protein PilA